jgi:ubiquinone/menaquinone biosynthesis C-methylase UbiE
MTEQQPSKSPHTREYYDRAAGAVPEFTVLNYGFSSEPEDSVIAADEPEFYCLRLYEHTVRGTPLAGRSVLEVSCGRGGGASFVSRTFAPQRYVGVDLSEENVRLARARAARSGVEFVVGQAEQLDFPDESFDAIINIEASHLYDDRGRFFAEALRVLRPGGYFCYTDGCWADDDCTDDLLTAGFELLERQEITDNVIRALRRDSARREALFDAMANRDLREEYKHWGGVIGYRAYERFTAGQTRYFSHRLRRPDAAAS